MKIEAKVQKAEETFLREHANDPSLEELRLFYSEMKRAGVAQRGKYTLPLLDTIGFALSRPRL